MNELFLSTPPGLEEVCAQEAEGLGLRSIRAVVGGVECSGEPIEIFRANASLRTASRVLVRLASGSPSEARALLRSIDWPAWLPGGAALTVEVSGGGQRPAPLVREVERAALQAIPSLRLEAGGQTVALRLAAGQLTVSLDSSGDHLHLRGYRQELGAAPLRENLAAGILRLAGYDGSQPLLDPMCGSGTFLIEAALLSRQSGPGLERAFACERWPRLASAAIEEERERLRSLRLPKARAPILGSDRNAGALGVSRRNAVRAGVFDDLRLERRDATELEPPPGLSAGVLVANPPYGKRSGESGALPTLYRRFGERLREAFPGWTVAILVADPGLGRALRLPSPDTFPLRNGGLPCTLFLATL